MSTEDSLLVTIITSPVDFKVARDDHWYRIPMDKAQKWGKHHWPPQWVAEDNRRDNALEAEGWRLLRFNTAQIREEMDDYCLPTITETVKDLGGLSVP